MRSQDAELHKTKPTLPKQVLLRRLIEEALLHKTWLKLPKQVLLRRLIKEALLHKTKLKLPKQVLLRRLIKEALLHKTLEEGSALQSKLLSYIRGYVEVEISGKQTEQLINEVYANGYSFWHVRRTGPGRVTLLTDLKTFFVLRPLLRKTGCKVRVGKRYGFPFLLRRLESRIFFVAGFVCFILGIYLMSQLIWKVEIEGNERIAYDDVLSSAYEAGIHPFRWKFRLREPLELARMMTKSLEGAAWVGVEVKGTRVLIKIVEQTVPEKRNLMSPRHLVSRFDAVVTGIFVEKGRPTVRVNAKVKKGDVLVSGAIGNDENRTAVVAAGSVRGLVWHEYTIRSPLTYRHKVYTGEKKIRRYAVIGNRALQVTGYGKPAFGAYESDVLRKSLAWRQWRLPLGWIKEEWKAVQIEEEQVSAETAKQVGLTQARGDILQKSGKQARITGEKILHEKIEGGKVYMKVLFEVEQEIAIELPIIQGD